MKFIIIIFLQRSIGHMDSTCLDVFYRPSQNIPVWRSSQTTLPQNDKAETLNRLMCTIYSISTHPLYFSFLNHRNLNRNSCVLSGSSSFPFNVSSQFPWFLLFDFHALTTGFFEFALFFRFFYLGVISYCGRISG